MKFLVGYNGSEEAKAALSLARTYAEKFSARVVVVTSMGGGRGEKPEKIGKAAKDLAFAEQFLKEKGIVCESHQLARGMPPGEDLVRFAEKTISIRYLLAWKKFREPKKSLSDPMRSI